MAPKISVILPTFNRAGTLTIACESVLNQSFKDLELIVVDDGSSDNTADVVKALGDERVRYLRLEVNGGAAFARNKGLAAARGEFIAFQDSDDLWLPGKLSTQLAQFETLPDDVGVVTGLKIVYGRDANWNYGEGRVACAPAPSGRLRLEEDQVKRCLSGNRISLQNALFRRTCYPDRKWFDPCAKADEDWEFTARLAQHTRIFEDVKPFVLAFISPDSISRESRKTLIGLIRIIKKNRHQLSQYNDIYANHLITLGRSMYRFGKSRWAFRFILAGLMKNPPAALSLVGQASRRSYTSLWRSVIGKS